MTDVQKLQLALIRDCVFFRGPSKAVLMPVLGVKDASEFRRLQNRLGNDVSSQMPSDAPIGELGIALLPTIIDHSASLQHDLQIEILNSVVTIVERCGEVDSTQLQGLCDILHARISALLDLHLRGRSKKLRRLQGRVTAMRSRVGTAITTDAPAVTVTEAAELGSVCEETADAPTPEETAPASPSPVPTTTGPKAVTEDTTAAPTVTLRPTANLNASATPTALSEETAPDAPTYGEDADAPTDTVNVAPPLTSGLEARFAAFQAQLDAVTAQNATLSERLENRDREMVTMSERLESTEAENVSLRQRVAELSGRLKCMEAENAGVKVAVSQITHCLRGAASAIEDALFDTQ
ncbi:hypothetical protein KIPB_011072 [Kipferlia bialata]|uniref:Uncharacterized protein n=1 Tax=Kipferlia bialata TaxID=797122 RepID=A0A9K3D5Z9_9EUKA|nr:hypothetical protein KIPB_011072 [Kipferlia bialata]|eukprot:g11072.t1